MRRKRVAPLAPDERRAAIIAATLPLLRDEGLNVSTRKIAECAGVAEGTIFRVFPDKDSLITAAIAKAFDPQPAIESMNAVKGDPDLRFRLKTAVRVLARRFHDNVPLMVAIRASGLAVVTAGAAQAHEGLTLITNALAELLAPDQHQLRLPAETIAALLMTMVMQNSRNEVLSAEDIVTVVLDGVLYPGVKDADTTSAPPPAAV